MLTTDEIRAAMTFEAAARAWPPHETAALHGWQLRFSGGGSQRANSVQTLRWTGDDAEAAIVLAKARERGAEIPDDVAFLIAKKMRSNVRDLEGALNTLTARANFTGRAITTTIALVVLGPAILSTLRRAARRAHVER